MTRLDDVVRGGVTWPRAEGDTNLVDVVALVRRVEAELSVSVLKECPATTEGVAGIEVVEACLFHDKTVIDEGLIRYLELSELVRRCAAAANKLDSLLGGSTEEAFVSALYAWHGCLNMAKACRPKYRTPDGEREYTLEERLQSYAHVQRDWRQEAARGNTWVRYGVSVARPFERGRGSTTFSQRVIDYWVPKDSPYWEN